MRVVILERRREGVGPATYARAVRAAFGDEVAWADPGRIPEDADHLHVLDAKPLRRSDWCRIARRGLPTTVELHDDYFLPGPPVPGPDRLLRSIAHAVRRRRMRVLYRPPVRHVVTHARCVGERLGMPTTYVPLALPDPPVTITRGHDPNPQGGIRSCPRLLFVGRDRIRKGFGILADAVRRILPHQPDLTVRAIGGDFPHGERWSRWKGCGLPIEFLGPRPYEETRAAIASSTAVVLPSHREGIPHVMIEALAAGVPFIGTYVDGMAEVFDTADLGWPVPPGDPAALADAIDRVLAGDPDAPRRLAAGRDYVAAHHTLDRLREGLRTTWNG